MNSDPIEIALPSDQNYFPGLLVTMFSLAKNASQEAFLSFNILDGGIKDSSFKELEKAVLRVHAKSRIRRFTIDEQIYDQFPSFHGNRMTYVRFLLPSILSDTDFVIYADSDCLWFADIFELWQQRDKRITIKAVFDSFGDKSEKPWFLEHHVEWHENRYFCNGLLLMNLHAFRQCRIVEKAIAFVLDNPDVQYADQTAFNAVIGDGVALLPEKWNYFTRDIGQKEVIRPIVLHYANQLPWRKAQQWTDLISPFMNAWFDMYEETKVTGGCEVLQKFKMMQRLGAPWLLRIILPYRFFRWPLFGLLKLFHRDDTVESLRFARVKSGRIV